MIFWFFTMKNRVNRLKHNLQVYFSLMIIYYFNKFPRERDWHKILGDSSQISWFFKNFNFTVSDYRYDRNLFNDSVTSFFLTNCKINWFEIMNKTNTEFHIEKEQKNALLVALAITVCVAIFIAIILIFVSRLHRRNNFFLGSLFLAYNSRWGSSSPSRTWLSKSSNIMWDMNIDNNNNSKKKTLKQTLTPEEFDQFIPKSLYGQTLNKYQSK